MKSKTKIGKQIQRKTGSNLVKAVLLAKKNPEWLKVASMLSTPRRKFLALNLGDIEGLVKEGETVVVPGKVLSQGELTKKVKIVALKFSEIAKEKLLKSKIFSILKDSQKNFVKMLKRKSFCLKPNTKLNIQVLKLKQRDYLNWVKESPLLFAILSAISTKL